MLTQGARAGKPCLAHSPEVNRPSAGPRWAHLAANEVRQRAERVPLGLGFDLRVVR